jgi:hypothetical protein|tara:strand:- start:1468 stop:1695 length:228 start_codon:yes stop_codon:yes gene_type:complete
MPYPMKKKEFKIMEFTCIKCEHKFHHTLMDTDERICYVCLEENIDYEPTTADKYNKDYIKERIKGSKDGYWESRS